MIPQKMIIPIIPSAMAQNKGQTPKFEIVPLFMIFPFSGPFGELPRNLHCLDCSISVTTGEDCRALHQQMQFSLESSPDQSCDASLGLVGRGGVVLLPGPLDDLPGDVGDALLQAVIGFLRKVFQLLVCQASPHPAAAEMEIVDALLSSPFLVEEIDLQVFIYPSMKGSVPAPDQDAFLGETGEDSFPDDPDGLRGARSWI